MSGEGRRLRKLVDRYERQLEDLQFKLNQARIRLSIDEPSARLVVADFEKKEVRLYPIAAGVTIDVSGLCVVPDRDDQGMYATVIHVDGSCDERERIRPNDIAFFHRRRYAVTIAPMDVTYDDRDKLLFYRAAIESRDHEDLADLKRHRPAAQC